MKTKVLIVISNMEFGGAQRQVVELANNIDQEKFELHVCSLSMYTPLKKQLNKNIKFHIINKNRKFDLSVILKLRDILKRHQINIIHSYLFDAEIASRLAAFFSFSKVKIIGSERNNNYRLQPHQKFAIAITKHLVDLIIANSTSGAEFNAQLSKIDKEKYRVIYNGVNTDKFTPKNYNNAKNELNISSKDKVIGIFASFKEQKNHPILLQAFSEILPMYPNTILLLVGGTLHGGMHGSDSYNQLIQKMVLELNLNNNCIFLGNRDDVENIYPACDFTVLPSLYEGTPNVILESMACGVPAIATNVSDNERIVINNVNGLLIDSENIEQLKGALTVMLEGKNIKKMAEDSRKFVIDFFSSKMLAVNTQEVYIQILKGLKNVSKTTDRR